MKRHRPVALAAVVVGLTFALPNAAPALGGTGTPVALEGTLRALHSDDLARGRSTIAYQLLTRSHGVVSLTLTRLPEDVAVGMRVRIEGMLSGHTLAAAGGSVEATGGTTAAATTGGRTTAVILFNFSNDTRQPWTTDAVRSAVFTGASSVNAYYQEQSFGRVSFVGKVRTDGDVYGWYTIPNANTGCDAGGWSSAAKTAAQNAGVDLSGYQHIVYGFPRVSGCGWAGMAYLPGTISWIDGYMTTTSVVGHELGHNIGVHHASSLSCTANGVRVSISTSCTSSEYGDPFDIMGQNARHMNTWHKAQLGWYDAAQKQDVTANGTYLLNPIESASTGLQLLRVPRGTSGDYYYLEYRRPLGFDNFSSTDAVVNGVSIRIGKDYTKLTQSQLIDATPGTTSFTDAALGVGKTFTDPVYGISFTTQSVSSTSATIQVVFGGANPPPPPPPPGDTTAPTPPGNLRVTATTTSSITIAWDASTDNVGVAGYGIYRGTTYLGSATTTAVRLVNLLCGTTYTFGVDAYDAAGNRSTKVPLTSTTSSCSGSDTTAPSAPTNLTAQPQIGPKVALAWTGSTDNVAVTGYRVYRGGVEIGTSTTASYTDASVLAGNSYTYTVKAYDAAGNLSAASNSATATISGGGGGLDTTAPTTPTGLRIVSRTSTSVTVAWTASTDNVGVTGYGAYRGGVRVGDATTLTYTFTGLVCGGWYTLAIDAVDAAGNRSAKASVLSYSSYIC